MIPFAQITQWRQVAPWTDDMQVEQDLILSRAIVEIFSNPFLASELAFRGGTALHKLFFHPAARYSEDIDLVRTTHGGIKEIIDALRKCLGSWLGEPKTRQTSQSFKLLYQFAPEMSPSSKQKIKVKINIQESFSILERLEMPYSVESDWFRGNAKINTFQFEELLATKLRALYERKKGRDAFDLWLAINTKDFDAEKTMAIFLDYMAKDNKSISKKLFTENLHNKLQDHAFMGDIGPLLSADLRKTHSQPITTEGQGRNYTLTENNQRMATEGWDLADAVEVITNTFLTKL